MSDLFDGYRAQDIMNQDDGKALREPFSKLPKPWTLIDAVKAAVKCL